MIDLISSLTASGYSGMYILAIVLAYTLAILFSITIHEFAHAFTAYKFGDSTPKALGRLSLNPFKHLDPIGFLCLFLFGFGWAKPVEINPSNFKKYRSGCFWTSFAGVLANLISAFISSFVLCLIARFITVDSNLFLVMIYYMFMYLLIINIMLSIFNLLPIFPLDGYNLIASLSKTDNGFLRFMRQYGNIILLIVLITPIFDHIYEFISTNILILFFNFWGLIL